MSKRLVRVQSFLAKVEATEGVDPTLSASNAVRLAASMQVTEGAEYSNLNEDAISETIARLQPLVPAGKYVELAFPVHLRGYGSAYSGSNLPEADALLQACGLSQTVVTTGGSESVTYELLSTSQKSCYVKWFADGMLHAAAGCRGTVALEAPAGQPMTARFTLRGVYVLPTDTALTSGTYQATVPPNFAGASSLTFNGVSSLVVRSFGADLANQIAARGNGNASDGLAGYHIPGRTPRANFVCEAPLAATTNLRSLRDAATAVVLDTAVGSTQYNRIKTHFDKFTVTEVATQDGDGFLLNDVRGVVSVEGTEDFALIFD